MNTRRGPSITVRRHQVFHYFLRAGNHRGGVAGGGPSKIDGNRFRQLIRYIQEQITAIGAQLSSELPFEPGRGIERLEFRIAGTFTDSAGSVPTAITSEKQR